MRYDTYTFCKKEIVRIALEYLLLISVVAYLFYDSIWAAGVLLPGIWFYFKLRRQYLMNRRRDEVKTQFIQMIASFSTAVGAGYSVENSLCEAKVDIDRMFEGSYMSRELEQMINKVKIGTRIESVLFDFAQRSGIQEIRDFAIVFSITRKNGAGFASSITRCVDIMESQKDTEREIEVLLSGKKYEQMIMTVIPIVILAYLRYTSPDFVAVWYHNNLGVAVMTVCLGIYVGSFYLARRITDIRC